jgi:zinc finger MYND domain-containing protein 10
MEQLLARGAQVAQTAAGDAFLVAPEAERIVEGLRTYNVDQIGSDQWMEQQGWVEKLNLQSHHNAQCHADEFVKDFLVSYDKITVLVHELLLMEVWRERLLPILKKHLARKVSSVTVHLLTSHEANLANLLQITLFHEQALDTIEEDHLIELVDWCHRQLQYLNTDAYKDAEHVEHTVQVRFAQ